MSSIVIQGMGAVSPAGWSAEDLLAAIRVGQSLPVATLARPGLDGRLNIRRVPTTPVAPWSRHPRLRRASQITRFATAAAIEALGADAARVSDGSLRLGIVYCVMAGCVNYSSRFYQEVMADPATASPLLFPETVFNAPASHLAALLGTPAINYTVVGDDTAFIQGLATAAGWLAEDRLDGCLVIGAEECDWLTSEAMRLFDRETVLAEGAGAIYLRNDDEGVRLEAITSPRSYSGGQSRAISARRVRVELETLGRATQLFDAPTQDSTKSREGTADAWGDWTGRRTSLRRITGDAFNAASAWQMIAACQAARIEAGQRVWVTVDGCNQAAVGLSVVHQGAAISVGD